MQRRKELTEKEKVELALEDFHCAQHTREFIIEILMDYPSLREELESYSTVGDINLGKEHGITKPRLIRKENHVTLLINT